MEIHAMSNAVIWMRSRRERLPRPIRRALRRLDHGLRAAQALSGLGTTAIVVAALAALGMAGDFAWVLPQAARWAIWAAWAALGLATFVIKVVSPLGRRARAFDLAAVAERGHPEIGEPLTGAVSLLDRDSPAHGSPALIEALAAQAAERASRIVTARVVPWRRSLTRLGSGACVLGLLAAPILIWPLSYGTLARRFLMPWVDLDRVGPEMLVVKPGDQVLPAGADLAVSASLRSRFGLRVSADSAWLEWSSPGQSALHRVAMPPVADNASQQSQRTAKSSNDFAVVLPKLGQSISYRVTTGGTTSRTYQITVLEPPFVKAIVARIEPPAYSKLPVATAGDPSRIEAFEDSRVTVDIETSRPVRSLDVDWPAAQQKPPGSGTFAASLADDGIRASITLTAEASGPYMFKLRDQHGITNRGETPRHVIVRPDAPPEVAVGRSDGPQEASPDDVLTLGVAARDDIAVASVELHYATERGGSSPAQPGQIATPLRGIGSRFARGEAALPLGKLALRPGDGVTYRIRVADNRPAPRGPNVAWSSPGRLTIVAGALPMQVVQSRARRSGLRARLAEVRKATEAQRQEIEKLRATADQVRRGDGEWSQQERQALDDRETAARTMENDLERIGRDFENDSRLRPLAEQARQIGSVEAEAARASLEQARRGGDPAARVASLEQAGGRLAALSERLGGLERAFDGLDGKEAEFQKLRDLARRQEALAASELAGGNRSLLDMAQAGQNSLRNDLHSLLKNNPELRVVAVDSPARQAQRLADAARALAQRQRELSRSTTDRVAMNPALAALAKAQRALDADARRLAIEVDQPLAENSRARLNTDSIHQPISPIERGEFEQARDQLEGAENELRRLARDIEDVPADPKALAGRLARRQDALNRDIDEALRSIHGKELAAEEKARFAARMKSFAAREQEIARLTATIVPPDGKEARNRFPHDAARDAAQNTTRAVQSLVSQKVPEIEGRKNDARQALERLANELPDAWRRQEPIRQKFDEALRLSNEIAEEIARHLRETTPRPDHPSTASLAAQELADRLRDATEKQTRVIAALEAMEPEPRVNSQRDRALAPARELAGVLRDLRDPAKREAARDVLAGAEAAAHATMDRLEQKLNGRVPADDLAVELALDQDAIQQEVDAEVAAGRRPGDEKVSPDPLARSRSRLAAGERALAGAVRGLIVPEATLAQAEAVRMAERAASELERPGFSADPSAALAEATESVHRLARQLTGSQPLPERIAAMARAQRSLNSPEMQSDPVAAANGQRAIALGLARLAVPAKRAAQDAVARAVDAAERAAVIDDEHPASSSPTPAALADVRSGAAKALEELAAAAARPLQPSASGPAAQPAAVDPELPLRPAHLTAARELVDRERRIRLQLQAILGNRVPEQMAVRRESIALGRELAELRDSVRRLSDRTHYPAHEAAQHLGVHAPQAMDQGAGHLALGQARPAQDAQRRSAELLERGAQHAEDLALALRADRQEARQAAATPTSEATAAAQSPIAHARDAMARALRQIGQSRDPAHSAEAVPAARQAMEEAARELRAAAAVSESQGGAAEAHFADEPGARADTPAQGDELADAPARHHGGSSRDPQSRPGGKAEADLSEIKELIRTKTGRTWGELPGHLRTEILQSAQSRYRDDYARLIQLYFREITAGSVPD
jgi:hypothetical protein